MHIFVKYSKFIGTYPGQRITPKNSQQMTQIAKGGRIILRAQSTSQMTGKTVGKKIFDNYYFFFVPDRPAIVQRIP